MIKMIYPPGQNPEIPPMHEPIPSAPVPEPYAPPREPENPPLHEPVTPQVPDPYVPPIQEPGTPLQP
jgi:hypothetical protein